MAQLTYPGVYIEEVPSGVRAISAVSSSIAAFVDRFRKGPKDRAIQVFGMADVERIFGGVDPRSPASYGLAQFFLNGGSQAYVVRVETATVAAATTTIADDTGTTVLALRAASDGAWANELLRVRIGPPEPGTGVFETVIAQYASTAADALPVAEERYRVVDVVALVAAINAQSALVTATTTAAAGARPAPNGLVWSPGTTIPAADGALAIAVHTPNGGVQSVSVTLDFTPAPATMDQVRLILERGIRDAGRRGPIPALAGASVRQVAPGTWQIVTGRSGYHPGMRLVFTGAAATALGLTAIDAVSSHNNPQEYVVGAPATWGLPLGAHRTSVGGNDGGALGAAELIGDPDAKTGMYALRDVDLFNILCIPAAAELASGGIPDESAISAVYAAASDLCAERRAFLLIDPPPDVTTREAMEQLPVRFSLLRSPNAAWYVPRVAVADPAADFEPRTIAPSGTIAGVFARTDADRGPWVAPAGVDAILRGVQALEVRLSDPENGVLNRLGVNCLRSFPVQGRIVWGARTLEGHDDLASEWRYVPIRRLALMIEESLVRGTKWAVFQPNDEPLWARLRQNVGAFMHRLFRQRAFQGATPREAYFVRCDRQTNPPEDRELGIVTVEVGFAPLKPAEFVVIRIQQIAELTA